ncbi:S8 family serine peptidase [Sphaerimonospora sp. CA-214678]|uniref:S8 family serine peptidase n=1 Tax=Sphaerimonospora sp. CA-214678 TaxID=3240029 RepID=UPI003D90E9EE
MNARGRFAAMAVSMTLMGAIGATACAGPDPADHAAGAAQPSSSTSESEPAGRTGRYLVFYASGGKEAATRAVTAAGGTVIGGDDRLGYLMARTGAPERIGSDPAVVGVSLDRPVGRVSSVPAAAPYARSASRGPSAVRTTAHGRRAVRDEPLADRQWDMKMIGATPDGSYGKARGSHKVLVGVIDTGVDGNHPDIAPNFNRELSRNFVMDEPNDPNGKKLDGPCEHQGCKDPADVDDDGHGTHVASTIGSPLNGIGIGGVAPDVSLVNLRAGTDSGYFFLKPTMDALAYAGDVGVDVVNMSFYVDPWAFNCTANPQDSQVERLDQKGVIEGMRRALAYARERGVTLITAIGNSGTDLGMPKKDTTSPNYPLDKQRDRKIDNTCVNVPAELDGVISVTAVGPSGRKSAFSDYGIEQADIAAPGGDLFDSGTELKGARREILAAAPESVLRAKGSIGKDGRPKDASVVRDCQGGRCAYYQYLEGTSMAAPHATGVAAIIIGRFGEPGKGGVHMDPAQVEKLLYASAVQKACPSSRAYKYGPDDTQVCEGDAARNGFFGRGVVDAARAATVTR